MKDQENKWNKIQDDSPDMAEIKGKQRKDIYTSV